MFNNQLLNKSDLQKKLTEYLSSYDVPNSDGESQIIIAYAANKNLFIKNYMF